MNEIKKIQDWYDCQCDGEWEHQYGISISTLDNPGWLLKIDLTATVLAQKEFLAVDLHRSEDDWITARKRELVFEAFGGNKNLSEMIETFFKWESIAANL